LALYSICKSDNLTLRRPMAISSIEAIDPKEPNSIVPRSKGSTKI
jgi:hypothetical protein